MKKKLLFTMLCIASALGMNAQTWTGNAPEGGKTFYLYNIESGKFLNNGDPNEEWGTNAYLQAGFGMDIVLEATNSENVYKLNTNVANKTNHHLAESTWCDGAATDWEFRAVTGQTNVYQIVTNGQYIMANGDLNDVEMVGNPGTRASSTYWKLVSEDDFKAAMQAKTFSTTNPMDVSIFIKGRSFARNDGRNNTWTTTHNGGNWVWIGASANKYYGNESWNNTFDVHQTITGLPDGTYEVQCSGFGTNGTTYIYGNNTANLIQTDNTTDYGTNKEAKWKAIHEDNAFAGQTTGRFTVSGGELTVGIKRETNKGGDWAIWDEFRLYYYGLDLSEFAAELAAAVTAAEAVESTVPTAAYDALSAVVTAQNKTYTTAAQYTAATNAIVEATNTAKALQPNYARYKEVRAAVQALSLGVNVTAANSAVENATTNEGIDAAVTTLRSALLQKLPSATIPADPGYIDVTAALVDNAGVRINTDYWTAEGTPNAAYSWGKCSNNECEFYQQNFKFYQTLSLIRGTWEFGVTGFHRAGDHSTYFYAGEDQILIPGVANTVVNTMAAAETYFDEGNGKVALKFSLEAAQSVEIGIDNKDTQTDKWTIFRDFTLKYYGNYIDLAPYAARWTAAVENANAAKANDAYKYVTGEELTALNAAIDDAPDGSSKENYIEKINALNAATDAYKNAAPSYNAFVYAKANAPVLDYASAATTAAVNAAKNVTATSAADAVAKTTALNNTLPAYYESHALAEGVTGARNLSDHIIGATNPTSNSTWTIEGVMNDPKDANHTPFEPWTNADGSQPTSYYDGGNWGQNSWTTTMEQTITIPAGKYLLTAKGRSAVNTELTMAVGDTSVRLPHIGASGGMFGSGWSDGSIEFTTSEANVTILITAISNTQHEWFSISDFRLIQLESNAVAGDVDGNGTCEMADVKKVVDYLLGNRAGVADADVDSDGTVSLKDVTKLVNIIKKK